MITRPRRAVALLAVLVVAAVVTVAAARFIRDDDARRHYLTHDGWPSQGQAAYTIGSARAQASPGQRAVPIASVAKVMTALLVLRAAPLHPRTDGFTLTVEQRDVDDLHMRKDRDESTVQVAVGEHLTERQALAALLLPSANNIAILLARQVAGSVARFVARMNAVAYGLGMRRTTYTDPSGYDDGTRSTAADQLVLAQIAMRNRAFATIVALPSYRLPVAGTVHNTDFLLGTHGFVGIKTGSDDAAGGCFMFRAWRMVAGARVPVTGVVLGQRGHNLIAAALYASSQLTDRASAA